jgi:HAE1 family hydrophobic/amphiphilic exporter-1
MRLTRIFVERPPLVFVTLAVIALLGGWALATLVQQQFPNVDFPTVSISVSYPGAPPSELRDAIVRPIEDAIAGAPNLDHIDSSIQQNQASIRATFTLDSNQTTDLTEVQDRVQAVRAALPVDMPPPTIRSFDPAQATVVTISVTSPSLGIAQLSAIVTDKIVPALEQVPGVSNVNAGGVVTPALEVTLDPAKLSGYGFTANDVVSAIQQNNVRAPGGIAYLPGHETALDVRGDVQTPEAVAHLLLTGSTAVLKGATSPSGTINQKYTGTTGSTNQALSLGETTVSAASSLATNPFSTSPRLIRIADVATVSDAYEPKRVTSYVDGLPAITLSVQKATGASEVTAGRAVLAALPSLEHAYPQLRFKVLNNQADFTRQQLMSVVQTLIEGIIFTGVAMIFFLRSWRNALVVMIAIPASLLVSLVVMKLFGFTIDTVSLLAMTLIVGILVDDSIVVLENIERHYEDGETPGRAAIIGRTEIGVAAIVITLVDVVVFLPIAFLPGQTGRFLSEFGVVVTIATLTSLAISFTVTPGLAGNWSLHSSWRPPRLVLAFSEGFLRLRGLYVDRILPWALHRPKTIIALSAVLTLGAIALLPLRLVGFEFMPPVDRGEVFVQVQYPTGTPLTTTDAAIRTLTNAFMKLPDVRTITSTAGSVQLGGIAAGGGLTIGSSGQLHVFLAPDRRRSTEQIARMMTFLGHRLVPDARIIAIPATGMGGGNSQPIDFTVSTTRGDPEPYAAEVLRVLEQTPGTAHVNSTALQLAPQIDIEFNRDRARALDLDIGSAASAVRAAFGGTLATQFDGTNGIKYVQVLYPLADQTSLATLRELALRTRTGAIVHLGDVAVLKNAPAQSLIARQDRRTVIHLSANVQPGAVLSTVQADFLRRLRALHLPNTVIIAPAAGGMQRNMMQAASGIGVALLLSSVLVYLLMVALYDAYRIPLVVMFSIPVAAIGAFGSLWLTHQNLNINSLIGLVMLVGLVAKNGILLVDFARVRVAAGIDKATAIRHAARERFRPILMTTLAMITGMLPMALALDPGSAGKRSLGTVVIGGLSSSLLLTLVLVPVVYCWLAPGPPPHPAPSAEGDEPSPALVPAISR